jgi:hypothetical protein
VEHQQYMLRGAARVGIGDEVHDIRAGMVVHIPAGVEGEEPFPTGTGWRDEEPFEFLCMVPADEDRVELLGTEIPSGGAAFPAVEPIDGTAVTGRTPSHGRLHEAFHPVPPPSRPLPRRL